MITAPHAAAWAIASGSGALLALLLWRGGLRGRLMLDALAIGVTLGAAVAVALAPFELRTNPLHFSPQTLAFLFAGIPEEGIKMIGAAAFLRGHYLTRMRRDTALAAGALALGFAALENLFYLANAGAGWATLAVERALTAVPFHVFEGLAGGFVVASVPARPRGIALAVLAWLALAGVHGAYDFAVFAGAEGATVPIAFSRAITALGLDLAGALRLLLGGAEIAAALAAGAALFPLRGAPAPLLGGRISGVARSRALGRILGALLILGAILLLAFADIASLIADSDGVFFGYGVLAIMPAALGLLFLLIPAYPARPRRPFRPRVWAAGAALLAFAVAVPASIWGPPSWRKVAALRLEARGVRLAAQGDYAGAIDALTRALPDSPDPVAVLSQRAAARAGAGLYDVALADVDAAIRQAPETAALYAQRANIDRQRNDPRASAADLDDALKRKPGDPDLLALRGQARLEAGDPDRARDDLVEALRISPGDGLAQTVFAAWKVDRGDYDGALRDLNARLHAAPTDAGAAFQRGRVWLYKGDRARAVADFARADRDPGFLYPALWRFLAEGRLREGAKARLDLRLVGAPDKWPAPVARMLIGQSDADKTRAAASNDGERCEADFYFAAARLDIDPADDSAERLRKALGECPTSFIEYEGAKAALRRLGR